MRIKISPIRAINKQVCSYFCLGGVGLLGGEVDVDLLDVELHLLELVHELLVVVLLVVELLLELGDLGLHASLVLDEGALAARHRVHLVLQLVELGKRLLALTFGQLALLVRLHELHLVALESLLPVASGGAQLVLGRAQLVALARHLLERLRELLHLLHALLLALGRLVALRLQLAHVQLVLLLGIDGRRALLALVVQVALQIAHLLHQRLVLLLAHVHALLQLLLELGARRLHVHLESELGVLARLQLVLELLDVLTLLVELRLEHALGLLQLVGVLAHVVLVRERVVVLQLELLVLLVELDVGVVALLDVAQQVEQTGLFLARLALHLVLVGGQLLAARLLLGHALVEALLLLLELHARALVLVELDDQVGLVVGQLLARLLELVVGRAQLVELALPRLGLLHVLALELVDLLQLGLLRVALLAHGAQLVAELLHLRLELLLAFALLLELLAHVGRLVLRRAQLGLQCQFGAHLLLGHLVRLGELGARGRERLLGLGGARLAVDAARAHGVYLDEYGR